MDTIIIWDSRSRTNNKTCFYFFQFSHKVNSDRGIVSMCTVNDNHISLENSTALKLGCSPGYIETEMYSVVVPVTQEVYDHFEMVYGADFIKALRLAEELSHG